MEKYKNRSEVPDKYKWDLHDFFKDEAEFNKMYDDTNKLIEKLKKYEGKIKDSNELYNFLNLYFKCSSNVERIYVYSYLINDQELGNSKSIARKEKSENLVKYFSINEAFFLPELISLSREEYDNLFKNKKLLEYKKLLDDLYKEKEHVLSKNEEEIINNLEETLNHFSDMSSTMLNSEHDYGYVNINGNDEKINSTNYRLFLKNKDRDVRKNARESYNKTLGRYLTSSSMYLNYYVKNEIELSKLHKFSSPFASILFSLNMPKKAYDSLVNAVENNVNSLTKYFDLYKKVYKLDDLYQYDINLELANNNREYSIEDAQKLCLDSIKPLGDDYVKHFKKVFDNHYIDYAQYEGKCSGGYSFAPSDLNSRILLSYNYDLSSVSTIIHEGGHNVHHQYVSENNPIQYRGVSSLVCEVASLTNECLLSSYLAENGKTKEEKLAGIANILEVIVSNLFGATREGHMESDFYDYAMKGNSLTKDYMNKLTIDSLKKYYGDSVKLDEYSGYSWARRSHYYDSFYLYNYAFCISVASYVANNILNGNEDIKDKYIKFLKTGSNVDPIDAFKILGANMEDENVYLSAIKYFDSMIDKFNSIYEGGE